MIYSFKNDYSEIAHKKILERLVSCAHEQNIGYGLDSHTLNASKLIKKAMDYDNCDIHFITGGTQTNMLTISSFLKPYEAVISSNTGHINVHETGAIEGTGHKVVICDSFNGKILPEGIRNVIELHSDEHMVKPKMVYISNSTEIGTVYTKEEIVEIRKVCDEYGLYLFLDGARLASALCSEENDLSLNDLANLMDVFYIGGTKNGACIGEALVIINDSLKSEFRYQIKHRGALLAKGFFNAINFEVLFEDDLYFEIGRNVNKCSKILTEGLKDLGFDFMSDSSTNQIFPIFSNELIEQIKSDYLFEKWCSFDSDNTVIRLVTSFNTTEDVCNQFLEYISNRI